LRGSKVESPSDALPFNILPPSSTQVRPRNLVHDKEGEADYYDLKRGSEENGSEGRRSPFDQGRPEQVKRVVLPTSLTQVRPGNLVHDEEGEADYYDLKRGLEEDGSESRRSPFDRGRPKQVKRVV
jgi:hypothetical protein